MTTLYRVQILDSPEMEERWCFTMKYDDEGNKTIRRESWELCPVDWEPTGDYIDQMGTNRWVMPALDRSWRSRSSAADRCRILNDAGYRAIIQRSAPIVWPKHGEKTVRAGDGINVASAIRTLVENGVVDSADELLGMKKGNQRNG